MCFIDYNLLLDSPIQYICMYICNCVVSVVVSVWLYVNGRGDDLGMCGYLYVVSVNDLG